MNTYPPIVYASQYGGRDADAVVGPVIKKVIRLTKSLPLVHFGDLIQSLSFVFRVDGSISQFNFTGCQFPKVDQKNGYATVDIGITTALWTQATERELLLYLADSMEQGYDLLEKQIKRKKHQFDFDSAREAVRSVTSLLRTPEPI